LIKERKILAIIPAREGSKRLPQKNKMELNGKALIEWTIQPALESNLIDTTLISTDDNDILELVKKYDVLTPFKRPKELADDTSTIFDVIVHAIEHFKSKEVFFSHILLLQPTSPLRNSKDIEQAIQELNEKTKSIVSVCETEHSPLWTNILPNDLSMKDFIPKKYNNVRSQDLPSYYRLNGAIYLSEIEYYIKNKGFFGADTYAYVMPNNRSIDIDNKIDFELCKIMMNENS
jgi:CMP-N,N'-diacetyllegionaminic acid synthase